MRGNNETIGQYAKRTLLDLNSNNKLTSSDIHNLQNPRFGIDQLKRKAIFPVLLHASEDPTYGTGMKRYYANDYLVFEGDSYYITSQWYNPDQRGLDAWVSELNNREQVVKAEKDVEPEGVEDKSHSRSGNFREVYNNFLKEVAAYSGYTFNGITDLMAYYDQTDDKVFAGSYYMLISIRKGRNEWAHPESNDVDSEDIIEIGFRYLNILTRKLENHNRK